MGKRFTTRGWGALVLAAALVGLPASPAVALQPLEAFVAGALAFSSDARRARAQLAVSEAAVSQGRAALLPGLQLRGTYTRNQYEVILPVELPNQPPRRLTIQPGNQVDGYATLVVPLINLANFSRLGRAQRSHDAQAAKERDARRQVAVQVVDGYYQLASAVGRLQATERAVATTQRSLQVTEQRLSAGSAAVLDQRRAQSAVANQLKAAAQAEFEVVKEARRLETLSGLTPDLGATLHLDEDDLAEERPLAEFVAAGPRMPAVLAAGLDAEAAAAGARAERLALVPALSGQLQNRLTNVTGFSGGHSMFYAAALNLTWNGDFATRAAIRAADAQAAVSRVEHRRVAMAVADDIFLAWQTVRSSIAESRAARSAWQTSREAADTAGVRYASDMATQLELLEAQRDSFDAEATRATAEAGLVGARIKLRLLSGERVP